ncbi:MAG: hypothetical protein HPZ91_14020 [Lentisphaeria bacterium]|nr:hypothetical protein [Lentisphaeria bacterium]
MRFLTRLRDFLVYLAVLIPYEIMRLMPYCIVRGTARLFGWGMNLIPSIRNLVRANVRTAFPEYSETEVVRIANRSLYSLTLNMAEFVWLNGRPDRIERCYVLPPDVTEQLKGHVARGERIIFVNPHLGSWEASGVMAPYYAGVDMVAIAKPVRNPYLNKMINSGNREKVRGLEIIFSNGAIRAATKALREGRGVGTLIDQNTRVRDGGSFVDFFGLPVPSSTAPAHLMKYCVAHNIPAVIIYGTSVRHEDGRVHAHSAYLPKPFEEYRDETEVLQDLMKISESYIRRYPDQYLWFYRRFQNIEPTCPEELKKRYPYYAKVVNSRFYRKTQRDIRAGGEKAELPAGKK